MKDESARSTSNATLITCSTCGRRFSLQDSLTPPFCSERCQLIDLGRWLDESIGLPFDGEPGDCPVDFLDNDDDGHAAHSEADGK